MSNGAGDVAAWAGSPAWPTLQAMQSINNTTTAIDALVPFILFCPSRRTSEPRWRIEWLSHHPTRDRRLAWSIFFGQHPFRVIRGRMGYIDFAVFFARRSKTPNFADARTSSTPMRHYLPRHDHPS
jgi:hypothetical protein